MSIEFEQISLKPGFMKHNGGLLFKTISENEYQFKTVIKELPTVEFGAHLHLHATAGLSKIEAALRGGCLRFDGAIRGIGGCPLAQDALVGNAPTEKLIEYFVKRDLWSVGNERAWDQSQNLASEIFSEI